MPLPQPGRLQEEGAGGRGAMLKIRDAEQRGGDRDGSLVDTGVDNGDSTQLLRQGVHPQLLLEVVTQKLSLLWLSSLASSLL